MTDALIITRSPGYVTLTIDRPERRNAVDETVTDALTDAFQRVAEDTDVHAVIITGAGDAFMAGGDIDMFDRLLRSTSDERAAKAKPLIDHASNAIRALHTIPQPTIAAIEGPCVGYGMSLMMACDLAIAAQDAVFMLAHVGIGASPDGGATWMLPRLVSRKRAMAIALLHDRFDAPTALDWGLLNQIAPKGDALAQAETLAAKFATGPQVAQRRTKQLLCEAWDHTLDQHLEAEAACFAEAACTPDFDEGISAFRQRRQPRFGA